MTLFVVSATFVCHPVRTEESMRPTQGSGCYLVCCVLLGKTCALSWPAIKYPAVTSCSCSFQPLLLGYSQPECWGAKITGLVRPSRLCGGLEQGHHLICTSSGLEPSRQRLFCLESRVFEVCVFIPLVIDVVLGIEPKFATCSASASWLTQQC